VHIQGHWTSLGPSWNYNNSKGRIVSTAKYHRLPSQ